MALTQNNQFASSQDAQTIPFENITNILNKASSLLPQTSVTTSSNKENASKADSTGERRGPMP